MRLPLPIIDDGAFKSRASHLYLLEQHLMPGAIHKRTIAVKYLRTWPAREGSIILRVALIPRLRDVLIGFGKSTSQQRSRLNISTPSLEKVRIRIDVDPGQYEVGCDGTYTSSMISLPSPFAV
jgi:hypothetical protein